MTAESTSDAATSAAEFDSRYRMLVESMVDAVVTIDERGAIEFLNPAAERMFGYARRQLLGKNVSLLMPEPDAKISGIGREVVGKRADGSRFPLELDVSNVSIDGRRFFIGVMRDITERRRLELQLFAARQAAVAANEAKTSFLRKLGHELRTPLTPIMGYAELLLDEALSGEQQEAASAILRNAELLQAELSRLLDAVIDYEQGKDEPAPSVPDSLLMMLEPPDSAVPAPLSSMASHTARVLVAEDSEENQRLLQQMLSRCGIQPSLVASGRAAVGEAILAANSGRPYDLILMDVQMPEMNGWEASSKLRAAGIRTPIIAITALSLPNDVMHCLESGCQEVLKKPLKFNQLVDVLERWLPGRTLSETIHFSN